MLNAMWGRMVSCGGLATRLVEVQQKLEAGRIANPPQDTILPHMGR
jgi:hypothetical protein